MFLNTSGGLASGDRLSFAVTLRPDTRALATTQTAERAYRATGPAARAEVRLTVGHNGWLDWLPQETILFDGSALSRQTCVSLAADAWYLGVETVILGRAAMGERSAEGDAQAGAKMIEKPAVMLTAVAAGIFVLGLAAADDARAQAAAADRNTDAALAACSCAVGRCAV